MTKVLVIEDNANLAFGLTRSLESEGYEVEAAEDGTRGLELARTLPGNLTEHSFGDAGSSQDPRPLRDDPGRASGMDRDGQAGGQVACRSVLGQGPVDREPEFIEWEAGHRRLSPSGAVG